MRAAERLGGAVRSLAHFAAGAQVSTHLEELSRNAQTEHVPLAALADSPWQPRAGLDPAVVDVLTNSIRERGLVEPIIVRRLRQDSGKLPDRFEILGGHCRVAACRRLADERGDSLTATIEARVYDVGDKDGMLLTIAENLHTGLRAWEQAQACLLAQRALGESATMATIGQVVGLEKGPVSEYVRIGKTVTVELLRDAGVVDSSGHVDFGLVRQMEKEPLLRAAKSSAEDRVTVVRELAVQLRMKEVERRSGVKIPRDRRVKAGAEADGSSKAPRFTYEGLRDRGGFAMKLSKPFSSYSPEQARRYLDDLLPALVALAEIASGGKTELHGPVGPAVLASYFPDAIQFATIDWAVCRGEVTSKLNTIRVPYTESRYGPTEGER